MMHFILGTLCFTVLMLFPYVFHSKPWERPVPKRIVGRDPRTGRKVTIT